jgi:hypothetical protein
LHRKSFLSRLSNSERADVEAYWLIGGKVLGFC